MIFRVDLTMTEQENSCLKPLTSLAPQLTPVLMELELFEPALFTGGNREAVGRFVEAILSRIEGSCVAKEMQDDSPKQQN